MSSINNEINVVPLQSSLISDKLIEEFNCDNDELNAFLKEEANKFDSQYRTQTILFYTDKILIGFYSTRVANLELENALDYSILKEKGISIDDKEIADADDNKQTLSIPCVNLAYLGVNKQLQYQNYGTSMIQYLYNQVVRSYIDNQLGIGGILLSSVPEAEDFYSRLGFVTMHKVIPETDFMTYREMFIDIGTIAKIIELD